MPKPVRTAISTREYPAGKRHRNVVVISVDRASSIRSPTILAKLCKEWLDRQQNARPLCDARTLCEAIRAKIASGG
jgi:hypothetical protein